MYPCGLFNCWLPPVAFYAVSLLVVLCRLVGSVYHVESLVEKGRRFESDEPTTATVAELSVMNPHVAAGKKFRCKIIIDGLQPNQGWWFMSCDSCSWKAVAEGAAFRCTKESCNSKHASPRYRVPIVASGDGASVEMVFFGDIARDLIGKPVDVLLAESCALVSAVPDEITGLVGRSYVVDLAVSRFSYRKDDISFQVLKFYPEGSSVFAGSTTPLVSAGKTVDQACASGLANKEGQVVIPVTEMDPSMKTPPPGATLPRERETSGEDDESGEAVGGDDALSGRQRVEKSSAGVKRTLFTDASDKAKKKASRK